MGITDFLLALAQEVDLRMQMPLSQRQAHVHRHAAGAEGDDRTIPAAVVQFAKTGAGEANNQRHQPARVAQRLNLVKAPFYVSLIQQIMFGHDDDVLHLGDHMHVDPPVAVFARGGQTLSVLNGGEHNGVRGDGAFNAVHSQRQAEPGRELLHQRALCAVL